MSLGVAALGAAAFRSGITQLQGARGWLCSLLVHSADPCGSLSGLALCRRQHTVPERRPASTVPEDILRELHDLNSALAADSRLDGRQRRSLVLSAQSLPAPLPLHEIEPDLPSLEAHVRPPRSEGGMARCAAKWLRRSGRVPGQVHSLMGPPGMLADLDSGSDSNPDLASLDLDSDSASSVDSRGSGFGPGGRRVWELNVHFDERELARMVRTFGRNGCTARVLQLKLIRPPPPPPPTTTPTTLATAPQPGLLRAQSPAAPQQQQQPQQQTEGGGGGGGELLGVVRVKPVRVFMNAVSQRLEGIELIYCPQDRVVLVDVPVRLANDEMAPGVRKGGWMNMMKRTVRYKALGNAVPPFIEVNVRHMDLDQDLLVRDLPVPPGTKIYEKDFNAPVVRCTTDVGKD
ncbi:hypothetical protein PLESTB_000108900 [Pleodorina starrii]|uniref:Large ribosomal subunit protein bL25 beta domain-containing protein n=1 Tax=Pleodorina starrii TaxID=330485 RepID=A0A9W6EXK5_9CHLO|nr:hypothetical protein PLESTM_000104500 [Pleodorina starrii]GLC48539.1 hypothetical protein PLESTB_000108900 [Pleodorina starrii]GLC71861.1 hypothetical protein PLESTF_001174800 [Pleodorina starrii]